MEIIATDKRTSWRERLLDMEVGETLNFDLSASNTVSPLISIIKQTNPGVNWTVKKIKVDGVHHHGQVTRLA